VVFVAQVDDDGIGSHGQAAISMPSRKRAGRVRDPAVLEGAGLAFVAFTPSGAAPASSARCAICGRRKTGAAEAAQAGILQRRDQTLGAALAAVALPQQRITAPAR